MIWVCVGRASRNLNWVIEQFQNGRPELKGQRGTYTVLSDWCWHENPRSRDAFLCPSTFQTVTDKQHHWHHRLKHVCCYSLQSGTSHFVTPMQFVVMLLLLLILSSVDVFPREYKNWDIQSRYSPCSQGLARCRFVVAVCQPDSVLHARRTKRCNGGIERSVRIVAPGMTSEDDDDQWCSCWRRAPDGQPSRWPEFCRPVPTQFRSRGGHDCSAITSWGLRRGPVTISDARNMGRSVSASRSGMTWRARGPSTRRRRRWKGILRRRTHADSVCRIRLVSELTAMRSRSGHCGFKLESIAGVSRPLNRWPTGNR